MTWLIQKAGGWLAGVGALILLFLGTWAKGRAEGKAAMREEQERHRREAIANKRKLDSEIDDLGPADVDHRFRSWVRSETER